MKLTREIKRLAKDVKTLCLAHNSDVSVWRYASNDELQWAMEVLQRYAANGIDSISFTERRKLDKLYRQLLERHTWDLLYEAKMRRQELNRQHERDLEKAANDDDGSRGSAGP